ncbi:MAG: hypothetical protein E7473_04755 [Ruminococcaceae bacterium]|nr:hypothetical protein [Oscillospiraceae bacterium]
MQIELSTKQFRRLLDMVYIGNWVLNSARGNDRIPDFDKVESYLFSQCPRFDMNSLCETVDGEVLPSQAFSEGGIHEAIMDYEDSVFYEILAEELAHRDVSTEDIAADELISRRESYIREFENNGITNVSVDAEL